MEHPLLWVFPISAGFLLAVDSNPSNYHHDLPLLPGISSGGIFTDTSFVLVLVCGISELHDFFDELDFEQEYYLLKILHLSNQKIINLCNIIKADIQNPRSYFLDEVKKQPQSCSTRIASLLL